MSKKIRTIAARAPAKSPEVSAETATPAELPAGELLDIDEAMARLKTTRPTFYRWLRTGKLKGMKVGRQWRFYKKDIESFLKGEDPQVELPADIRPLIQQLADRLNLNEKGKKAPVPPEATVITAVNLMILLAVKMRASDLHLEPVANSGGQAASGRIRLRVDGVLHGMADFDGRLLRPIVERWKAMTGCDLHDREHPQDGRITVQVGGMPSVDLRACFLPTHFGESVTLRILNPDERSFDLARIDYAPRDKERLTRALKSPWGLIVCSGPAGSGKTTLLYSCLNRLVQPEVKIVSIENSVEVALPGVTQLQVNPRIDPSVVYQLRAVMRSDPDVIMIGELRDTDTLTLAVEAALTGHLVLTTLHTEDAATALIRLVQISGDAYRVSEATRLILAQRLIRKLCPECSKPEPRSDAKLERVAAVARAGGLGELDGLPGRNFRQATGCAHCKQTGYVGRTVVAETLNITPEVVTALRRGASAEELRTLAIGQGMIPLAADALRRASLGQVSLDEALRYAPTGQGSEGEFNK